MSTRTLVAYASRAGSTAEVAQTIGDVLREHGLAVDVRSVKDVDDVSPYDALVLGTAIWAGKPLPELQRFLKDRCDAIADLPIAYFIQCDTLREYTPANQQIALGYVAPLRRMHEPVGVGLFAGRRSLSGVHPLLVWIVKRVFRIEEGDWRDWDRIKAWAATIALRLAQADAGQLTRGAA